ncbi:hypothetical protein SAMN02745945_01881 [Peptoclostridium litorale DSM 5388]|uniref:Uncharacterized protein n=1 Tax=Peptoclostridium litorale DSM 5388 TaxID=1121324 RepID=A0A069RFP6_PEPLI|nr:hypothetical protein [Peptoclostridium litorale]KDR95846.1 hypothetical protein CLIT_8c00150 [Peptoclostridium litorale DSM 5388]SIO11462.1 hypothetical protein SAMN02745945_01881 [Peptoclostridium litorale DSM 5388]
MLKKKMRKAVGMMLVAATLFSSSVSFANGQYGNWNKPGEIHEPAGIEQKLQGLSDKEMEKAEKILKRIEDLEFKLDMAYAKLNYIIGTENGHEQDHEGDICHEDEMSDFERFLQDMGIIHSVSDQDRQTLEELFTSAIAADENGEHEKAERIWDRIFGVVSKYEGIHHEQTIRDIPVEKLAEEILHHVQVSLKDAEDLESMVELLKEALQNENFEQAEMLYGQIEELIGHYQSQNEENIKPEMTKEIFEEMVSNMEMEGHISSQDAQTLRELFQAFEQAQAAGSFEEADKWMKRIEMAFEEIFQSIENSQGEQLIETVEMQPVEY